MSADVPPKVYELIKQVVNDDIEKFSIRVLDPNKKGEGYLGDMCYVSLEDRNSGKIFNFVVKQAFVNELTRKTNPIRDVFMNEIFFYTTVWPSFQQFQKDISPARAFNKIVKCFGTTNEDGYEKLVLENIKFQNFVTIDKKTTFDREHIEYILKEYGKYHALSFAYRALNPEGYSEISKNAKDLWIDFEERKHFAEAFTLIHELCLESLQPGKDEKIIEKYKYYVENPMKIFHNSINYTGIYSAILHGDCWSNNMMFKYDESGKLSDVRFLDFQLVREGTPVNDLAYLFYSGGSKKEFDQLDHYLRVYHNSLSETVKEFGLNPEDIYPFKALKQDWKQHCQFGFIMSLLLWKSKLTHENELLDLSDYREDQDTRAIYFIVNYDQITFKKRTRDLILHMYEYEFLLDN